MKRAYRTPFVQACIEELEGAVAAAEAGEVEISKVLVAEEILERLAESMPWRAKIDGRGGLVLNAHDDKPLVATKNFSDARRIAALPERVRSSLGLDAEG